MIRRRRLIYNTALLTVSSLLMSCIGMAFQVWLVGRIGWGSKTPAASAPRCAAALATRRFSARRRAR